MGFTFAQNGQPFITVIASAICGLCAVWLLALQQQFVNGCMRTVTPAGSGTAIGTTSTSTVAEATLATTSTSTFAETAIATTSTSTFAETAIATSSTSTLAEATIATTPTSTFAETTIATTSTSTFAETTTTTTPTMTMNEACNSCTAKLIVDRTQGDIPSLTNPCPSATPCPSGGFNVEHFPRGTASFDFQRSLACINPCICDQYICHLFGRVGISVRLSTQCTTTCSSTSGCTIRALVQSKRGNCLFAAFNPPLTRPFCRYFDGLMFDVKFLSCNGCPSLGTPTCGGQGP